MASATTRAVLFDLDGTLVDTTDLILASCTHTFKHHLGVTPSRDEVVATFGRSLPEVLLEVAIGAGLPDPQAAADEMLETYRAHNDASHDELIRPFDGVEEMLTSLGGAGLRLGVVTSKRERSARRGLARYRFERFFDVTVFHDDTVQHKPHPEPLLVAAERAGVPPGEAIYVGDSIHDVAAGRAAGMPVIAALWGPFPRADLVAAGPDAVASTPADVVALIRAPV